MDSESSALTTAIAIVSGANPIIAGAIGIIGGIFGGWFRGTKKEKDLQEQIDILRIQQLEREARDRDRKNQTNREEQDGYT